MGDRVGQDEGVSDAVIEAVFGRSATTAQGYVDLMAEQGVERGVIGPREVDRLWDRHVLNSALIGELIPHGSSVLDVGSGAGLPGVPLAIARPDLDIVLLEPMARRVEWLEEVLRRLDVRAAVVRGRAEERAIRARLGGADIVTARALAPLSRLGTWCLPLARPGGVVLAMKGASADEEIARDRAAIRAAGATAIERTQCGVGLGVTPATVVMVTRSERSGQRKERSSRPRRSRK